MGRWSGRRRGESAPKDLAADHRVSVEPECTCAWAARAAERIAYAEIPPRVEYTLTAEGRTLEPVIAALAAWGSGQAITHR